jgi:hypothetical protein
MPDRDNNTSELKLHGAAGSRTLKTQLAKQVQRILQDAFEESGVITVQLDVIPPESGAPFAAIATIKWSDGGNVVQRMVSLVNGVMISGVGRVIDISVTDTTPAFLPLTEETATPGPHSEYTVTALVSHFPRPSESRPPTLYGGVTELTNSGGVAPSIDFPIPQRAGVISVAIYAQSLSATGAKPNLYVTATTPVGGTWAAWAVDSGSEVEFVPLPPGATDVVVSTNDTVNATFLTVMWGIDG